MRNLNRAWEGGFGISVDGGQKDGSSNDPNHWPNESNPMASGLRPLSNLFWFFFFFKPPTSGNHPPHSPCFQVCLIPLLLKTSMICYMPCGPLIPSQGSRGADLQTSVISHHCWLPIQHINLLPGITSCQKTEIQVRWLKH